MQSWRLFLVLIFGLGGGLLHAAAPHPSLLQVEHKGVLTPVIGFEGSNPVVVEDDKAVPFKATPHYRIGRAAHYAPGRVELSGLDAANVYSSAVRMVVKSDRDLTGAYAAIVIFDEGFLSHPEANFPATYIFARRLPDLPAGKEVRVTLSSRYNLSLMYSRKEKFEDSPLPLVRVPGNRLYFPLIFTAGGYEVRSNLWDQAAEYFHKLDLVKQKGVVMLYRQRFANSNRAPVPFMTPPPLLPPGEVWPDHAITATLEITAEGTIVAMTFDPEPRAAIRDVLIQSLGDWLFMPKLVKGKAEPTKVRLPLQF